MMAAKDYLVANGSHILIKIISEVKVKVMRQATNFYILSILIYAIPAWWLNKTWINIVGHIIKNSIVKYCKKPNFT